MADLTRLRPIRQTSCMPALLWGIYRRKPGAVPAFRTWKAEERRMSWTVPKFRAEGGSAEPWRRCEPGAGHLFLEGTAHSSRKLHGVHPTSILVQPGQTRTCWSQKQLTGFSRSRSHGRFLLSCGTSRRDTDGKTADVCLKGIRRSGRGGAVHNNGHGAPREQGVVHPGRRNSETVHQSVDEDVKQSPAPMPAAAVR